MNIAEHKSNLIRQIDQLSEESLLELEEVITKLRTHKKTFSERQFGCMKGLNVSMADDFDAPLSDLYVGFDAYGYIDKMTTTVKRIVTQPTKLDILR